MKLNIKKNFIKGALFVAAIAFLPIVSFAQPDPPGPDPDEPLPIDGGVSLLVAAGVGYGAKKLHDAKKRKQENKEA